MKIVDKALCYGCGACEAVCGKKAIIMQADKDGFLYPVIDDALCVGCNRCKEVCPRLTYESQGNVAESVVFKNKKDAVRLISSSGGFFPAVAEKILERQGAVYGAAYDEGFYLRHTRAVSKEEMEPMRGSKYVQSDIRACFEAVYTDLKSNIPVLFTGTPCQVAALDNYLSIRHCPKDNLLSCELICHGVPSPLVWKDHLAYLESKRHSKIVRYNHRSKVKGWHEHNEEAHFANGRVESQSKFSQNHKDLFYGHLSIREVCASCSFAGHRGKADFVYGDCWGLNEVKPEWDDNKGCSLLIPNTQKARDVLSDLEKDGHFIRPIETESVLKLNHYKPITLNPQRDTFWQEYYQNGFAFVTAKYANNTLPKRILYRGKKSLRRVLVKIGVLKP